MGFLDWQNFWRHEVRTADGHVRQFYQGCGYCRRMRCCVSRDDHDLHCAARPKPNERR